MPHMNEGVAIETTSTEEGVKLVFTDKFGHPTVFEFSAAAAGRLAAQLARAAANAGAPDRSR